VSVSLKTCFCMLKTSAALPQKDPTSQFGQSLIELALVLPILVLIVAASVDIGRAFYAYVSMTNAAREGARFGAGYPPYKTDYTSRIQARTQTELSSYGITVASGDITVTCTEYSDNSTISCSTADPGDRVVVQVNYPFELLTTAVLRLRSFTLSNSAIMAIDS